MMRLKQRKTGTKVRDGKVTRKNRTELSNHYSQVRQVEPVIDRLRPGNGFKHYLTIADIKRFVTLLPDWERLSVGLDAVILDQGGDAMGWHWDGVVAICAWERQSIVEWDVDFVNDHIEILNRLGVDCVALDSRPNTVQCHFDDASIKGFQLMHVLLHELGNHVDRMTTKSQLSSARGEHFAESYACRTADKLWDSYFQEFGW